MCVCVCVCVIGVSRFIQLLWIRRYVSFIIEMYGFVYVSVCVECVVAWY